MATMKTAIIASAIAAGVKIRSGAASQFKRSRIASFAVVGVEDENLSITEYPAMPTTSTTASIRLHDATKCLSSCESSRPLRVDASTRGQFHFPETAELDSTRMPFFLRMFTLFKSP